MTYRSNKSKNGRSGKTQNNSNNQSKKSGGSTSGKNYNRNNKSNEFKFQLHDGSSKRAYTYEKIKEAMILKSQTNFTSARYVVSSLRKKVKDGPPVPVRELSSKTNADEKAIEQETLNRKYEAKSAHYYNQETLFEDNWIKVYGLIYRGYCSSQMQLAIKELPNYESEVLDDPLKLLEEVEKLMHVPRKVVYPVLTLIETLSNLMSCRQGESDSLLTYLEKFKSEKNVVVSLFGEGMLDGHVESTQDYKNISDANATQQASEQKEMKKKAYEQFWGLLFLKQSDQSKYGHLLRAF